MSSRTHDMSFLPFAKVKKHREYYDLVGLDCNPRQSGARVRRAAYRKAKWQMPDVMAVLKFCLSNIPILVIVLTYWRKDFEMRCHSPLLWTCCKFDCMVQQRLSAAYIHCLIADFMTVWGWLFYLVVKFDLHHGVWAGLLRFWKLLIRVLLWLILMGYEEPDLQWDHEDKQEETGNGDDDDDADDDDDENDDDYEPNSSGESDSTDTGAFTDCPSAIESAELNSLGQSNDDDDESGKGVEFGGSDMSNTLEWVRSLNPAVPSSMYGLWMVRNRLKVCPTLFLFDTLCNLNNKVRVRSHHSPNCRLSVNGVKVDIITLVTAE